MSEEKVMYVNLPDGAEYRRVEVTEDGRIGIVYTEQDVSNEEPIKASSTVVIPKPVSLIGGSEVYQKDNGTPYWYCKIKEGRDEFMHIYFGDLTENDLLYDENGEKREFTTYDYREFKDYVLQALNNKPQEEYCWIPVFEPSYNLNYFLQYVAGKEVLRRAKLYTWDIMFKEYSPENGSKMASITTYFLLLLRWLKDGIATLEQLAGDSREIGHYFNSENTKHECEKTGERSFGGLFGFVGNTHKIVKDPDSPSGFSSIGGSYNNESINHPLSEVYRWIYPSDCVNNNVGLLELTK